MIGYKLFRFSVNADQAFIEEAMAEWIKEMGNISINHVAQDQIGDKLNMSVFYETRDPVELEITPEAKTVGPAPESNYLSQTQASKLTKEESKEGNHEQES